MSRARENIPQGVVAAITNNLSPAKQNRESVVTLFESVGDPPTFPAAPAVGYSVCVNWRLNHLTTLVPVDAYPAPRRSGVQLQAPPFNVDRPGCQYSRTCDN